MHNVIVADGPMIAGLFVHVRPISLCEKLAGPFDKGIYISVIDRLSIHSYESELWLFLVLKVVWGIISNKEGGGLLLSQPMGKSFEIG